MQSMFLNRLDIDSEAVLSPTGLCDLIQKEYQPEIISSCKLIEKYFSTHAYINELPSPVSEVVQLLFRKLDDELKHLFLKESGIVFPYIKKKIITTQKNQPGIKLIRKYSIRCSIPIKLLSRLFKISASC